MSGYVLDQRCIFRLSIFPIILLSMILTYYDGSSMWIIYPLPTFTFDFQKTGRGMIFLGRFLKVSWDFFFKRLIL